MVRLRNIARLIKRPTTYEIHTANAFWRKPNETTHITTFKSRDGDIEVAIDFMQTDVAKNGEGAALYKLNKLGKHQIVSSTILIDEKTNKSKRREMTEKVDKRIEKLMDEIIKQEEETDGRNK